MSSKANCSQVCCGVFIFEVLLLTRRERLTVWRSAAASALYKMPSTTADLARSDRLEHRVGSQLATTFCLRTRSTGNPASAITACPDPNSLCSNSIVECWQTPLGPLHTIAIPDRPEH